MFWRSWLQPQHMFVILVSMGSVLSAGCSDRSTTTLDGRATLDLGLDGSLQPSRWVLINPGPFLMGVAPGTPCWLDSTLPQPLPKQVKVTLTRAFSIQRTETRQDEYVQLMGFNPSHFNTCPQCPVEKISWNLAVRYCNALSTKRGLLPCYQCRKKALIPGNESCMTTPDYLPSKGATIYDCPGYRLPTVAEWEYALRAGTITPLYNGPLDVKDPVGCKGTSQNALKIAWFDANSGGVSHPVAQKQPNAWGLYDMAGNVAEWNHDYSGMELTGIVVDPWNSTPPDNGTGPLNRRNVRGGDFTSPQRSLVAGSGGAAWADQEEGFEVGFRCVRTISP
jgi:formylglycine-generating enzyme required for sulfatase activity